MLMNPQYPPAYYADMYRGHVPSYPPSTLPSASSAPAASTHHTYHHNNNVNTHEFYSNNGMTGSCYDPAPSHHGIISSMDTNGGRAIVPPSYGYAACNMPSMDQTLNMYPTQTLWQTSQSLGDDKRGSVIIGHGPPQPPAKRKGGRKPKDDPNLPPIEKEKRRLRRLRNKEAAAKCRERRLNHTSSLLQQIEQLEKSQKSYEDKITQLRQHKAQCEKLLQSHNKDCSKTFSKSPAGSSSTPAQSVGGASASPASTPSPPAPPPISTSHASSANRRKQMTPRLNVDISCSDLHRRTSSSSSGELQSPPVIQ